MHLGRARSQGVIRLEAWGSVDMAEIEQSWAGGGDSSGAVRLDTVWLYLEELQNLELVELSYREAQVRHVLLLVDAGGMSTAHAGLLRYLRSVRETNAHQLLCVSFVALAVYVSVMTRLFPFASSRFRFVSSDASFAKRSTPKW